MLPPLILKNWLRRVTSFREDPSGPQIIIGNIPPFSFLSSCNYTSTTRTLQLNFPSRVKFWILPSEEEKKVLQLYKIYYLIIEH